MEPALQRILQELMAFVSLSYAPQPSRGQGEPALSQRGRQSALEALRQETVLLPKVVREGFPGS